VEFLERWTVEEPAVSYDLLNSLFSRRTPGQDASGFYGIYPGTGENAGVIFDKEAKKSSEYIKDCAHWNKIFKGSPTWNAIIVTWPANERETWVGEVQQETTTPNLVGRPDGGDGTQREGPSTPPSGRSTT